MVGDEEWDYTDGIATLLRVRIVCRDCDAVTHIGWTAGRGYGDMARDHMGQVNGMTKDEADRIIAASFVEWRERSLRDWEVAVAPDLLDRYPDLSILNGVRAKVKVYVVEGKT